MFMRMTVANNIKSTFKKTESAMEFMKLVEECSQSESLISLLLGLSLMVLVLCMSILLK